MHGEVMIPLLDRKIRNKIIGEPAIMVFIMTVWCIVYLSRGVLSTFKV